VHLSEATPPTIQEVQRPGVVVIGDTRIVRAVSEQDRIRWDQRYRGETAGIEPGLPPRFAAFQDWFPVEGRALDLACGRGSAAVWLAMRGMEVLGVDVSPVAIEAAIALADEAGVADRCRFLVHDLDGGLPEGPSVAVLICHLFRDARLDRAMLDRLAPGGLLAIAVLSEAGSGRGRFRASRDELRQTWSGLDIVADGDHGGVAWLIGRRLSD
jgi:SAM-dependent methyltransferase